MCREGTGIDAVSPGEVFLALRAGFRPNDILFTGTSVSDDELRFLLEEKVPVNLDSLSQLNRLAKICGDDSKPPYITLRVNPDVGAGHHDHVITGGPDAKFGVQPSEAVEVVIRAKQLDFDFRGLHMHIGSGVMEAAPFLSALNAMLEVAGEVVRETGTELDFIDVGGGLGVPYKPDEPELDMDEFAKAVCLEFIAGCEKYGLGKPALVLEPGRYLVADSTVLLTRVNTLKPSAKHTFLGVDAGFNTLLRPAMYDSYHHIINATRAEMPSERKYDVAGPICESGDLFTRDRLLPETREGDLLAVLDVGAYGFSMASRYNSRPLPAEVFIDDGKAMLVRERETIEDMLRGQHLPEG
jgi:diaminopimelate decarboxylase